MNITLPKTVEYILSELEAAGYRADIVGGSVRDFLLGKAPGDYDITTSALPEEVKAACDLRLSFSKMTFPHRLMRVILLEQIYRAFTIINNGKYHH